MSEMLERRGRQLLARAMSAFRDAKAERDSANANPRSARVRFALARFRSAPWVNRLAVVAALVIPAQTIAFQAFAVSMLVDGPTIMCRADGGIDIVRDDGTTQPAGAMHDCCGHCLAASAPPVSVAVGDFTLTVPDRRAFAAVFGFGDIHRAQARSSHAYARGPPASSLADRVRPHAPVELRGREIA